jgi:hypothetical protein
MAGSGCGAAQKVMGDRFGDAARQQGGHAHEGGGGRCVRPPGAKYSYVVGSRRLADEKMSGRAHTHAATVCQMGEKK